MNTYVLLMFGNITNENLILVFVGYVVVFASLSILWLVFYNLPRVLNLKFPKRSSSEIEASGKIKGNPITGEETAAISAAIFLFVNELHDEENTVLTIQKISRRYSPWNSKIYSVTHGLNKRF